MTFTVFFPLKFNNEKKLLWTCTRRAFLPSHSVRLIEIFLSFYFIFLFFCSVDALKRKQFDSIKFTLRIIIVFIEQNHPKNANEKQKQKIRVKARAKGFSHFLLYIFDYKIFHQGDTSYLNLTIFNLNVVIKMMHAGMPPVTYFGGANYVHCMHEMRYFHFSPITTNRLPLSSHLSSWRRFFRARFSSTSLLFFLLWHYLLKAKRNYYFDHLLARFFYFFFFILRSILCEHRRLHFKRWKQLSCKARLFPKHSANTRVFSAKAKKKYHNNKERKKMKKKYAMLGLSWASQRSFSWGLWVCRLLACCYLVFSEHLTAVTGKIVVCSHTITYHHWRGGGFKLSTG